MADYMLINARCLVPFDGLSFEAASLTETHAPDPARMRRYADLPEGQQAAWFNELRKTYPRRRAFARHPLAAHLVPPAYRAAAAEGLGVQLRP